MQTYLEVSFPFIALLVNFAAERLVRGKFSAFGSKSRYFGLVCGLLVLLNLEFLSDPGNFYGALGWNLLCFLLLSFAQVVFLTSPKAGDESRPANGLTSDEVDLLFTGSIGAVLLTLVISVFLIGYGGDIPKSGEERIYLLAMIPIPPLAYFLSRLLRGREDARRTLNWNLLYLNLAVLTWVVSRFFVMGVGVWFTHRMQPMFAMPIYVDPTPSIRQVSRIFACLPALYAVGLVISRKWRAIET